MEALSMADLLAQTNQTLKDYSPYTPGPSLYDLGWRAAESNGKRIAGYCNYNTRQISLSRVLMMKATYAEQVETILHEIAHALTPGHSHDGVWRKQLLAMGGTGKRTHDIETPEGRYQIICPNCGQITTRHMLSGSMKHLLRPNSVVRHLHRKCGTGRLYAIDTVTGQGQPHVKPDWEIKLNEVTVLPVAAQKPTPKPTPTEGPECKCTCGGRTRGGAYLPGHDARHVSAVFAEWLANGVDYKLAMDRFAHAPKLAAKLAARIEAHANRNYK